MFFDYGMIWRNMTKKDTVMLLLRVLNMIEKIFIRTYSFWAFFFFMDPDMIRICGRSGPDLKKNSDPDPDICRYPDPKHWKNYWLM